ncbi:MAG: S-layer homology domain-containing protein [Elainella sp. Prado103]|nr:S-layer homology domain-containing protein [Elainella sp. Prado103]
MEQPPSRDSERRDPLSFDELIALIVAFTAVGAILWWGIGRRSADWLSLQVRSNQPETVGLDFSPAEQSLTDEAATTEADPDQAMPSPAILPSTNLTDPAQPSATRSNPAVIAPAVIAPTVIAPAGVPAQPSPTESPVTESPVTGSPVTESPVTVAPSPASPTLVVPSADPTRVTAFTDLPNDYWAYPFIAELSQRGIVSGFADGSFQPDQPVNRAQYAALVSQVLPSGSQTPIQFGDVPPAAWSAEAIDESVQSGFVKGYPDQTFQPDRPISRLEVLLSLVNGFGLPKSTNPDPALSVFQDQQQIPDWAKPAIATATESGLVVSYPDTQSFNPDQPATRAEVAAMLYQALTASGKLQPIQSNYIVRP